VKVKVNKIVLSFIGVLIVVVIGGVFKWLAKPTPKAILLTKQHTYFIPLKIQGFNSAHIPYLDMKIENKIIPVEMDLGFEGGVSLPSSIITKLHSKTFLRRRSTYALSGKTYMSNIYQVEEISIGSMTFFPVAVEEANDELDLDTQLKGKKESKDQGVIGWHLFRKFNLLIDCKHSKIALCDGLETLEKKGYPVHSFVDVPLLLDRGFIEFEAKTQHGLLRCVLDSGSTYNMLNKDLENPGNNFHLFTPQNTDQYAILNPENDNLLLTFDCKNVCELSIFNIGEKEFGPMTFNLIKSPLAIEAIMGMEFFEDTLIFIDFDKSKIYFFEYPIENAAQI
jgi:hypothetical protein